MELDKNDLKQGLRFICGTWQVDYIVNAFSKDLAHIPAGEWKGEDGSDFSDIKFVFTEDHTLTMRDGSTGKEEKGTWEQTGYGSYHYTLNGFIGIPDGAFRENAETLTVQEEALVFSIGFLAIGMKKIEEGHVTEEPDIGDITPGAEDEAMMGIVGKYRTAKVLSFTDAGIKMCTAEEVRANMEKQLEKGLAEKRDIEQAMFTFEAVIEFTADHRVITWMKIPASATEEQIRQAIEAGQISEVVDGYFRDTETEWKALNGKYYYNTREHREIGGEVQSSWDELVEDENGYLPYGSGMMLLERI